MEQSSPQDVEIPQEWLSRLYLSRDMLPFIDSLGTTQAIIPLDLDSALDELAWESLDEIYRRHRGRGRSTPKTLARQIDFAGKLSSQPRHRASERSMVLYPKSGDIMRAARTQAGGGFVDHSLYWLVAGSADEAAYLTALLNAPCLERAFAESRKSGRDFHQHPWRKVPIPKYNAGDSSHVKLARLCGRAEGVAEAAAAQAKGKFPAAGRTKLSQVVRQRLAADGILRDTGEIAARLLPDQAVTSP